jgi:hypothetical protein
MDIINQFITMLDHKSRPIFVGLKSPLEIQAYLDSIPYSDENANRSPLSVLRDGKAHCLDGGLFGAAALRNLGYPPLLIDMLPEAGRDDDHVLAIFKKHGHWGAVAKSNFSGLRYREPVFRTFRELVLSYFEVFFNVSGEKTMRGYTTPLHLKSLDKIHWMWKDEAADVIEHRFSSLRRTNLLTPDMIQDLSPVDERSFKAGMLGVNQSGLYKPH